MKAIIETVKDLATGRPRRITYLIPENENDLEQLRDMAATGESESEINPQDEIAAREGDDEEDRQMRADSLQDEAAARLLDVPLLPKGYADSFDAPSPRAREALAKARRQFWP